MSRCNRGREEGRGGVWFYFFFVIYLVARYTGSYLGLPQASRMEFVCDIVRMLQIASTWMFAVSPRYAPDMCMYVCLAFLCIFIARVFAAVCACM